MKKRGKKRSAAEIDKRHALVEGVLIRTREPSFKLEEIAQMWQELLNLSTWALERL